MPRQQDSVPAFDTAVARYKRGECPGCGKGFGAPKGLEYRGRSGDLYCHTCKEPWLIVMKATLVCDRLPRLEAAVNSSPTPSLSPLKKVGYQSKFVGDRGSAKSTMVTMAVKRLGNVFKKVALRR